MTFATIKVSKPIKDRLRRLADAEGLTLSQAIDKLLDEQAERLEPKFGGFRSDRPLSADEIDQGFGGFDRS